MGPAFSFLRALLGLLTGPSLRENKAAISGLGFSQSRLRYDGRLLYDRLSSMQTLSPRNQLPNQYDKLKFVEHTKENEQ